MLEINDIGDSTYIECGDPDRFFGGGIALFKAGKAQKLVFTGGKMPWNKPIKTEAAVLRNILLQKACHLKRYLQRMKLSIVQEFESN